MPNPNYPFDIKADKIEIHYWFNDQSHSMDAYVLNKCDYEILAIVREIAEILSLDIHVETEALGEGGLKKWLRLIEKEENKKGTITTSILTALITLILITPLSEVCHKLVDKLFEDRELNELQKEKLKLEIEQLRLNSKHDIELLNDRTLIKKRKSNFYETLESYPKIEQLSFSIIDLDGNKTSEKTVVKPDFKKFVLVSDDLEPLNIEEAVIEIVAPVLKKGRYRWIGYYNGDVIPFSMKSTEFKDLIQNGGV